MKFFIIFVTLLLSINTFSVYTARNVIEGVFKTILDPEFNFGENCITENFDVSLNDMYYFAHEYYYSYNNEEKRKYLIQFIITILNLYSEINNCEKINFMNYIGILLDYMTNLINLQNETKLKEYWKDVVGFENKLFDAYNSKEFSGSNFGIALGEFLYEINILAKKFKY